MTKKVYRKDEIPPSDMFLDSLSGGGIGSDELTCEWCGRLHLCPDADYYNDWNVEDQGMTKEDHKKYCEEEHRTNPDGVILHYDCDGVDGRYINEILFVCTCPCNGLNRFERFIWAERSTIREYLRVRQIQEDQWEEEQKSIDVLAGKIYATT
jgi:hypothetical protein